MGEDRAVEYLYKEYVRLSNMVEELTHSSFADFKLLAVVGFVVGWPPLGRLLAGELGAEDGPVLLIGFAAILVLVAIIATRDLIKQSVIGYVAGQLIGLEAEMRQRLDLDASAAFRFATRAPDWLERYHAKITLRFQMLFLLPLVVVPIVTLARIQDYLLAGVYAALAALVYGLYLQARGIVKRASQAAAEWSLEPST